MDDTMCKVLVLVVSTVIFMGSAAILMIISIVPGRFLPCQSQFHAEYSYCRMAAAVTWTGFGLCLLLSSLCIFLLVMVLRQQRKNLEKAKDGGVDIAPFLVQEEEEEDSGVHHRSAHEVSAIASAGAADESGDNLSGLLSGAGEAAGGEGKPILEVEESTDAGVSGRELSV